MDLHPEAATGRRLPEIDGLRAVAITLVVFQHSMTSAVVEALRTIGLGALEPFVVSIPGSGVELFFVLSGIVLLRPYLRRERSFSLASYTRRRVRRLWPPYLVALALGGIVYYWATVVPSWYARQILQPFDVAAWVRQAAIVNFGWSNYNLAWWSLTPEAFFYVIAPALVFLLAAVTVMRRHAVLAAAGLAALSVAWWDPMQSGPGVQHQWGVAVQFLAYSPCFAAGVLLARHDFSRRVGVVALGLGGSHFIASGLWPRLNNHIAFALLYGGLIILGLEGGRRLRDWLAHPVLIWLGERSYSLFLIHHSFIYAANHTAALVFPDRNVPYFVMSRALGLSLSLLGAMALFTLVERRFARGLLTADAFWPWNARRHRRENVGARSDFQPTVARVA